jgi:hypothetical protein
MGFFKRLFGGGQSEYVDKTGIYLYARCDKCGTVVRVRADKQHDLNQDGSGFVWHKTIVDSKCFRRLETVVHFDGNYNVTNHEVQGGALVDEAVYESWLASKETAQTDEDTA